MKGSSIDGRGHRGNAERRRKQKAAAVATAAAKLPKPTKAADLRPASPPKTSPWRPTWHVELKAADFPPLTELKLHTSSKRKPKRTQETSLQPPIPSPPTPSSPEARTYSKAGETLETASTTSTSTSSRKLFEDAAPRAGEMYELTRFLMMRHRSLIRSQAVGTPVWSRCSCSRRVNYIQDSPQHDPASVWMVPGPSSASQFRTSPINIHNKYAANFE